MFSLFLIIQIACKIFRIKQNSSKDTYLIKNCFAGWNSDGLKNVLIKKI